MKSSLVDGKFQPTHGMSRTPEFEAWRQLRARCLRPTHRVFNRYKNRGVCDRWAESFEAFYEDMGARPTAKHSLDRIDNNGPYAPENCRWATWPEQLRNTSQNVNLTHNGKTQCVTAWADETGIKSATLYSRLKRGWSAERALTAPVQVQRKAKPG